MQEILRHAESVTIDPQSEWRSKLTNFPSQKTASGYATDLPLLTIHLSREQLRGGRHTAWVDRVAGKLDVDDALTNHRVWQQVRKASTAVWRGFSGRMPCLVEHGRTPPYRCWGIHERLDTEENQNDQFGITVTCEVRGNLGSCWVCPPRGWSAQEYAEQFDLLANVWRDFHLKEKAKSESLRVY